MESSARVGSPSLPLDNICRKFMATPVIPVTKLSPPSGNKYFAKLSTNMRKTTRGNCSSQLLRKN